MLAKMAEIFFGLLRRFGERAGELGLLDDSGFLGRDHVVVAGDGARSRALHIHYSLRSFSRGVGILAQFTGVHSVFPF